MTALAGGVIYLAVTAMVLCSVKLPQAIHLAGESTLSEPNVPSWNFKNPDFDQWVEDIKREKASLDVRQKQLDALEKRLNSEKAEISTVTQTVYNLQEEFDKNVIRIKAQEAENLNKQAQVIAAMTPDGAAALLKQMPDREVVRLLYAMKPAQSSAIIDALSKLGVAEAKRAATITGLMGRVLPPAAGTGNS